MSNRLLLNLFFFFVFASLSQAQSPADWWYFGDHAGVHFSGSGPVADTNGAMMTVEGCASVSSDNGDLLFYTDGIKVWDASHQVMPNGDSLLGNPSSTQSAVIVPYPGSAYRYYIFTARGCTSDSIDVSEYYFAYSVVDMTLNGGLGDVLDVQKNVILFDSSSEKCTATVHANGTDIWVIGREFINPQFHAYHISCSGIVDTVTSNVGATYTCSGYLLANHAGDKIASTRSGFASNTKIFPFDQATGVLGMPDSVEGFGYGVHFSPNDQILYVARTVGGIFQYDLTASNVQSTELNVSTANFQSAIAEGPDKKLYIGRGGQPYLACIHFPDVLGNGCGYQDSAVYLDGKLCYLGLPNHVGSAVFKAGKVRSTYVCLGDSTRFSTDTAGVDSVVWNFGDPGSGALNQSTNFFPAHHYSNTGNHLVTIIRFSGASSDTSSRLVFIYPRQMLDLGSDTALCVGDTLNLDVSQDYIASYLWQDSSTTGFKVIAQDSLVWVTLYGKCDTVSDTLMVQFDHPFDLDLGPDTIVCSNVAYALDPSLSGEVGFEWNTGDTTQAIVPAISDVYILSATNACGTVVDSVSITLLPIPPDSLLPVDTINCFDNEIVLVTSDLDNVTYIWSDSSTKNTYTVDTTETVWLAAFNECGFSVDTIDIIFNGEILSELGEDTAICEGDSIALVATHPGATYTWNTGEVSDTIWSDQVETFNYVVTVTFKDCQTIESKRVDMDDFYCPPIDCSLQYANTFSPNSDGVNDKFRPWSDCEIYSFSMYIYNRWGQLIHSDNHVQFGWDGFINGEPAPQGVYFFVIDFNDRVVVDEDRNVYQGSFTLVR